MNEIVETKKRRELVAVPPKAGGNIQPFIPSTVEEIKWEVGLLIEGGLAPSSFGNDPKKVTIAVLKGLEVGLPPMMAVGNIAIINNRPTIWGDAALALVQSKNVIERMEVEEIGTTPAEDVEVGAFPVDYGFAVRIWRRGQTAPYAGKYTVGDAKRAHLWMNPKKAPWMEHPKRMLKIRATAFPLRDGFADCLSGLYIREEVEDMPPTQEVKADTSFLDDSIPEATQTDAEPVQIPVSQIDGEPDWEAWHGEAVSVIQGAPSGDFLDTWLKMHAAPLANLSVFSPDLAAGLSAEVGKRRAALLMAAT